MPHKKTIKSLKGSKKPFKTKIESNGFERTVSFGARKKKAKTNGKKPKR